MIYVFLINYYRQIPTVYVLLLIQLTLLGRCAEDNNVQFFRSQYNIKYVYDVYVSWSSSNTTDTLMNRRVKGQQMCICTHSLTRARAHTYTNIFYILCTAETGDKINPAAFEITPITHKCLYTRIYKTGEHSVYPRVL